MKRCETVDNNFGWSGHSKIRRGLKFIEIRRRAESAGRPHRKGGCYRCPTRTQHHRTFRPGISILRKSRTSLAARAPPPPSARPSRSHQGRTKGRRSDNFITARRSHSHARLGGGRRCELLLKSCPRRRLREGCQLLVNGRSVRTRVTRAASAPSLPSPLQTTTRCRVYKQVPT